MVNEEDKQTIERTANSQGVENARISAMARMLLDQEARLVAMEEAASPPPPAAIEPPPLAKAGGGRR